MVDAGMRIAGVNHMLKCFCDSQRLTLRFPTLVPVVPAADGHKTTSVECCDIRIIRVLLVELAHLGQVSAIALARVRDALRIIENEERVDQRCLHRCRPIDTVQRCFNRRQSRALWIVGHLRVAGIGIRPRRMCNTPEWHGVCRIEARGFLVRRYRLGEVKPPRKT